jgi:hypothetical protein
MMLMVIIVNLLMVQPLTSVNKIDGGTGDVKGTGHYII